jgi:hypothetical protein
MVEIQIGIGFQLLLVDDDSLVGVNVRSEKAARQQQRAKMRKEPSPLASAGCGGTLNRATQGLWGGQ